METAGALLRGRDLKLRTTRELREIHMGIWEGDSWGNLSYKWPEQMYNFNNNPSSGTCPAARALTSAPAHGAGHREHRRAKTTERPSA